MQYNIEPEAEKYFFLLKNLSTAGMKMVRRYTNRSGMRMRFNFSSLLSMRRVTGKYLRLWYENGEVKILPHLAPLSCLIRGANLVWMSGSFFDVFMLLI